MVILFTGILLIILGLISLFFATKLKPNYLIGYRSFRANKNQENFHAANIYAGKFLLVEGIISIVVSFFSKLIPNKYVAITGLIYFLILVLIMFIFTEHHLKKNEYE